MLGGSVLSVLVNVSGEDPALLDTLAALVPGAAEGLVRDVVLVHGRGAAFVDKVADAAGCGVLVCPLGRPERLAAGAARLKSDWILVLEAGLVPGGDWMAEAEAFLAEDAAGAACFTLARRGRPLATAAINLAASMLGHLHPLQGLIAKRDSLAALRLQRGVRLSSPVFDRRGRSRLR
jgi:hypothetical protein